MGFCTKKYILLTICILQFITLFEKQVFEFLGFLWIPILVNFLAIIFVIFGFFGTYQYSSKYLLAYSIWQVFWFAWNIFIICLYLDIGFLNHKECIVLKLDQGSESWWARNGPGCKVELNTTQGVPVIVNVIDCAVDYRYIEIVQAAIQVILAFLGLANGFCLSRTYSEEDDTFDYLGGDGKIPQHLELQPMYVDFLKLNNVTRFDNNNFPAAKYTNINDATAFRYLRTNKNAPLVIGYRKSRIYCESY